MANSDNQSGPFELESGGTVWSRTKRCWSHLIQRVRRWAGSERQLPDVLVQSLDPVWYANRYADVAESSIDPLTHFLRFGHAEGRFANARKEMQWRGHGLVPRDYGVFVGPPKGESLAAEDFDPDWYRLRNPELASGIDAVQHYLAAGRAEGRSPNRASERRDAWDQRFNARWYAARNSDLGHYSDDPLAHFVYVGSEEGRAPNP